MNDFNQSFKPQKPMDKRPKKTGDAAKKEKMNRIIYITAIALLLAVIIVAAVVSATNRTKKNPDDTPQNTQPNTNQNQKPNTDPKPDDNKPSVDKPDNKPDNNQSEDVANKLPSFTLPVSAGALSTKHDADTQVFSTTMEDYRVHLGVDINTEAGAPVNAAADGKVERVWEDVRMGWCVAVSHSGGAISYYKNLDEKLASGIEKGATVKAGQLLGAVGESAMVEVAQEPHLHFEMTVGGIQVDPLEYFGDKDLKALATDAPVKE